MLYRIPVTKMVIVTYEKCNTNTRARKMPDKVLVMNSAELNFRDPLILRKMFTSKAKEMAPNAVSAKRDVIL